jgi:hypothetical protein
MGECSSCGINTLKVNPTKEVIFASSMHNGDNMQRLLLDKWTMAMTKK